MNFDDNYHDKYQPGGSLPVEASTYVIRQCDRELFESLIAREYCYVLNARQMGKSSLRIQVMAKLEAENVRCAEIELNGIGSQEITAQQWYGGVIQELVSGFELSFNWHHWWRDRQDISPVKRLGEFIETILLEKTDQPLVIFVDEIDCVLSLKFSTDEFFALIRHCYDKRAINPNYRRLTFALLGVATPSDLINSDTATPFNIGRAIQLKGFELNESKVLAKGLSQVSHDPEKVLQEVLFWTGGQPFLTQKICWLIVSSGTCILGGKEKEIIEELIEKKVLNNWEFNDDPEHLRTIRDRILRSSKSPEKLLLIYKKLLKNKNIKFEKSRDFLELILSGLITINQGNLVVKNLIYKKIFNLNWVYKNLKKNDQNRLKLWQVNSVSFLIGSMVIGMRFFGLLQTLEIKAFDHLMRQRPQETIDQRFLLITITEEDVQFQPIQERGAASLSVSALAKLIKKLESFQPRVIGLDIYRESPLGENYQELAEIMANNDNIFTICNYGNPGVSSPPEIPPSRQGFNNVILDFDGILRRHLLAVTEAQPCENSYSFSWQLATRYLAEEGIKPEITQSDYLKLGKVVFKPLETNSGGYHQINANGHQILLNYRQTNILSKTLTLKQLLNNQFNGEWIRNRLVIIGTTAPSFNDHLWQTPHSHSQNAIKTVTGLEIQAFMVSQILSAVLDGRPLIHSLSKPIEIVVISSLSLLTGLLGYCLQSKLKIMIGLGVSIIMIYGFSWWFLGSFGLWFPLIPSILVLIMVNISLIQLINWRNQ